MVYCLITGKIYKALLQFGVAKHMLFLASIPPNYVFIFHVFSFIEKQPSGKSDEIASHIKSDSVTQT